MNFLLILLNLFLSSCLNTSTFTVPIDTRADVSSNNIVFSSSTQSFLRFHHALEKSDKVKIKISDNYLDFYLDGYKIQNIFFEDLIPRLPYILSGAADSFDLLNLRIMEYNRRGIAYARGPLTSIGYFSSNQFDDTPWFTKKDYELQPNPNYTPLRMSVTNNCLFPGLWEISANDQSGNLFHGWFNFPKETYYKIVAEKIDLQWMRLKKDLHGIHPLHSSDQKNYVRKYLLQCN